MTKYLNFTWKKSEHVDIDKLILNLHGEAKDSEKPVSFWRRRTKLEGWHYPIQGYHKAIVVKTAWYQWKTRQSDQWNGTESLETDKHEYTKDCCKLETAESINTLSHWREIYMDRLLGRLR